MKKILTSVFVLACCMGSAWGNVSCTTEYCNETEGMCDTPCNNGGTSTVHTCTGKNYVITANNDYTPQWNEDNTLKHCSCKKSSYRYKCAKNYYGPSGLCGDTTTHYTCDTCSTSCTSCPTGSTTKNIGTTTLSGCHCTDTKKYIKGTLCVTLPGNAIQDTYDGTNFICNIGYYKNGDACTQCPANKTTKKSGSTSASDCNLCIEGYYMNNGTCVRCPEYKTNDGNYKPSKTDGIGKTSITQCYIPGDLYFCDEKGCGRYEGDANTKIFHK